MKLAPQTNTPIILHLSDLHWGCDRRINKVNGRLALDYLFEDLQQITTSINEVDWPNVIVLSGDLTTEYDTTQYYPVRKFLEEIRDLFKLDDDQICVVPGNHDVSLSRRRELVEKHRKSKAELLPYIYEREFRTILSDFVREREDFPYFWGCYPEIRLCIFGFDSNMLSPGHFDQFQKNKGLFEKFLMSGRIGGDQLNVFDRFYNTMRRDVPGFDLFTKIVVLHHHVIPIPAEDPRPFEILTDAGTFLERLAQKDIDLVLHGHRHFPCVIAIKYGRGLKNQMKHTELLVLGAGSAGSRRLKSVVERGMANHYSIIKIKNWGRDPKVESLETNVEWRSSEKDLFDFKSFVPPTSIKIKEK